MSGKDPLTPATDAQLESERGWTGAGAPAIAPSGQASGIGPRSDWTAIRQALDNQLFDYNEDERTLRLLSDGNVVFRYLGAGTNKIAVHITGTTWVLLFANPARIVSRAKQDMVDEIRALKRLALASVPVPEPFKSMGGHDPLFHIKLSAEGEPVPAFLQMYMPVSQNKWAEMTKRGGPEKFAASKIVPGGRVTVTIGDTLDCLNAIRKEMDANPWNDFQVMYNRLDGKVVVFDPQEFTHDRHKAQTKLTNLALIDLWLDGIHAAIEKNK